MVFLVRHPAAIVDDTEQHQCRWLLVVTHPCGLFEVLEVGRAEIELPAIVAMFGLEMDGGRLAAQGGAVIAPLAQIPVDSGLVQRSGRGLNQPVRGLDAKGFDQADRFGSRQMASLLVRGADLDSGDQFAEPFQLILRQYPRGAPIGAAQGLRSGSLGQRPMQRLLGNTQHVGGLRDHETPFVAARCESGQAALQVDQHLDGNGFLGHGKRLPNREGILSSHIMTIRRGSCNIRYNTG